jgi:phosphate transport system substrate-binding protein
MKDGERAMSGKTRWRVLGIAVLVCMGVIVPAAGAELPGAARPMFAGSGANLPITRVLAEAFRHARSGADLPIDKNLGSTGAIRAAGEGAIAVALISRPLRDQEPRYGLTVTPYARTPLIFGSDPSIRENGLSGEDLVQILGGARARWSDGRDIVPLLLYPGDSLADEAMRKVPGLHATYLESYEAKRWTFFHSDQALNEKLPATPAALGLTTLGAVLTQHLAVKPLAYNGIEPSLDNLQRGRYPLALTLAFAYKSDALPPAAAAFIDFVRSPAVERLLRTHGYLPVR